MSVAQFLVGVWFIGTMANEVRRGYGNTDGGKWFWILLYLAIIEYAGIAWLLHAGGFW